MRLQFLVSAVEEDVRTLAERMNLQADAIIVNQCGENTYLEYTFGESRPESSTDGSAEKQMAGEEHPGGGTRSGGEGRPAGGACTARCYSFAERGVGLSRNNCLMRADGDICVFADEDIIYRPGAAKAILREFEKNPAADMILFNVEVPPERRTYHIDSYGRVRWYNCGRYPTYSFAARTERLHQANVTFSLLFGGGARYSNGEDSLFLAECIRKGLKVYRAPVTIGKENGRPSTWFDGYHEKFFYDRGVLYHYLYGWMAVPMAARFLLKHRAVMFSKEAGQMSVGKAFRVMVRAIRKKG